MRWVRTGGLGDVDLWASDRWSSWHGGAGAPWEVRSPQGSWWSGGSGDGSGWQGARWSDAEREAWGSEDPTDDERRRIRSKSRAEVLMIRASPMKILALTLARGTSSYSWHFSMLRTRKARTQNICVTSVGLDKVLKPTELENTDKWNHICLEQTDLFYQDASGDFTEAYKEASGELERMRNDEPNQHRAEVPWNPKVDKDALRRAYDALVQGNDRELQGFVDITAWSLDTLKQIQPRLLDGLRAGLDEARVDRWISGGFAKQNFGQFGKKVLSPSCMFVWLAAGCQKMLSFGSWQEMDEALYVRRPGNTFVVPFCRHRTQSEELSCVVTMQYDHDVSKCAFFVAEPPRQGACQTSLEAVVMANSGSTVDKLGDIWRERSSHDVENGTALKWRTVEEHIEWESDSP